MGKETTPGPGTLLLAEPMLADPNFRRAAVLLCHHTEEGSFGLMLNRPLPLRLAEVAEGLFTIDQPLYLGGPVQPETLHVLHARGDAIEGGIEVAEGIFWGGELEAMQELLSTGGADGAAFRFFLGYAGWTAGQLAGEIEQGGWIQADARREEVFGEPPERLWGAVLRRLGGDYAILSNFPADPRMN